MSATVGVIIASVRESRKGEAFARWFASHLEAREGARVELLDLKEWALPAYAHAQNAMMAEKAYPSGSLEARWAEKVGGLDAVVIVTPEYNHGYPGALKNALDHLYAPWGAKPLAIVSYGGFAAGARAAEQLRQVAIELRMVPVRDEVNLRLIGLATDDKGWPTEELYKKRANATVDDLLWWARVCKEGRERHPR